MLITYKMMYIIHYFEFGNLEVGVFNSAGQPADPDPGHSTHNNTQNNKAGRISRHAESRGARKKDG